MREAMTIRLPRNIQNALDALARQTGLTKTFLSSVPWSCILVPLRWVIREICGTRPSLRGRNRYGILLSQVLECPRNQNGLGFAGRYGKSPEVLLGLSTMDNPRESGMLVDGRRASYWCYLLGGQAFLSVIDDVRSAILVLGLVDGDLYHDGLNGSSDVRNVVFPSSESYQPILACGARVAAIRKQKGISQREFAKMLGTSGSDLSFMEHGKRPVTRSMAERMAALLGVPVRRVLQG